MLPPPIRIKNIPNGRFITTKVTAGFSVPKLCVGHEKILNNGGPQSGI